MEKIKKGKRAFAKLIRLLFWLFPFWEFGIQYNTWTADLSTQRILTVLIHGTIRILIRNPGLRPTRLSWVWPPKFFLTLLSEKYAEITVCVGTNRNLCRRTVRQKCRKVNNCFVDYGPWVEYLKNSNMPQSKPKKIVQPFGGFFQQIKVRQPIGGKDSLQTVIRISRRLD